MPCRVDEPYGDNPEMQRLQQYEIAFCALADAMMEQSAVEPKDMFDHIQAKTKVNVDLYELWTHHHAKDVARLKQHLKKFTNKDKQLLVKILRDEL